MLRARAPRVQTPRRIPEPAQKRLARLTLNHHVHQTWSVVVRHIERKIRVSRKLSGLGGTPGKSSSIPARGGFPQIASVCCSDRLPPAHAALTDGCEKETPREDT